MRYFTRFSAALTLLLGALTVPTVSSAGTTFTGLYASLEGIRSYSGYVPSSYRAGTAMPLVVAIHGCTQTGSSYDNLTRWSTLAEERGFIVVFPSQNILNNLLLCWNWDSENHQHRGAGEPSIIMGITDYVRGQYTVDPKRIFVTGASSGGVMTNIMAVAYPDVFAAAAIFAGCEYECDVTGQRPAVQSGQDSLTEMGSRARQVPVMLWQGTDDVTVPASTVYRIATQWATVDGIDDVPDNVELGQVPNGRSYTHSTYRDSNGRAWIELYMIDGAGHVYPGGCSCSVYGDPTGPDGTGITWEFFAANPMP